MRAYLLRGDRPQYEDRILPGKGEARNRRPTVYEGSHLLQAHAEHRILVGSGSGDRGVVEDEGPMQQCVRSVILAA